MAETCSECGFDARHWRVADAGTVFAALGCWWRLAIEGVTAEDLNRRPATGVWSVLEYGRHTSRVTAIIRGGIEKILAEDGCVLPAPPQGSGADAEDPARLDPHQVLDDLESEGARLAALSRRRSAAWVNVGNLPGQRVQAAAGLLHAAHDASHHFMDVARGLATLDLATPAPTGTLTQVNISGGGVPKVPLTAGHVTWRGLVGDRQADRVHHGRPFQALCLWSAEVIGELSAAGHPVGPGSAGENLTLSGIDWVSLRPGTRIRIGTAMVELSYPAIPCTKLATCFADGNFGRISHDRNPHWARWYAWVRQPGDVEPGGSRRGAASTTRRLSTGWRLAPTPTGVSGAGGDPFRSSAPTTWQTPSLRRPSEISCRPVGKSVIGVARAARKVTMRGSSDADQWGPW